jgi:hypothetical protein
VGAGLRRLRADHELTCTTGGNFVTTFDRCK